MGGEAYFPDCMRINELQMKSNWMFVADALGNLLAFVVPTETSWREVSVRHAAVPALADIISKVFLLGGVALAGSQTKSILYNSCIMWSALLSRFMLGRILSLWQWTGVGMIVVGLLVKMKPSDFLAAGNEGASRAVLIGIVFILIGCALHSATNVINEFVIRKYGFPPSKLCCLIGCFSLSTWIAMLLCGLVIPEYKESEDMWYYTRQDFLNSFGQLHVVHDVPFSSACAWIFFVVASAVHAVAYYSLLGSIGVVSCGVMKGLTTAGYVTLSAAVLCDKDVKAKVGSCMTWRTGIASVICVMGVVFYSVATSKAQTTLPIASGVAHKDPEKGEGECPPLSGRSPLVTKAGTDDISYGSADAGRSNENA